MKKYVVYVRFKNGETLRFETDSNVNKLRPQTIDGERFIVTENDYAINVSHVDDLKIFARK